MDKTVVVGYAVRVTPSCLKSMAVVKVGNQFTLFVSEFNPLVSKISATNFGTTFSTTAKPETLHKGNRFWA